MVGFTRAQGRFAVAALPGILALALLTTPARAFAPEAAAGIARSAAGAPPPAARWSEARNDAASIAVTRRLEAGAQDSEAAVESHRFDTGLGTSGNPVGGAAAAPSGARDALRAAFTRGDALAAGTSLALESAASRSAIEDAARNRDDATVAVTRRDRLEAALSVAGGMVPGG